MNEEIEENKKIEEKEKKTVALRFLIIGVILIILFVALKYISYIKTKDYIKTQGEFIEYEIYSQDEKQILYSLIYTYNVNEIDYILKTNYGTSIIPEYGSRKEIKYNPNNPKEAVIENEYINILLLIGIICILISLVIINNSKIVQKLIIIFIGILSTYYAFMITKKIGLIVALMAGITAIGVLLLFKEIYNILIKKEKTIKDDNTVIDAELIQKEKVEQQKEKINNTLSNISLDNIIGLRFKLKTLINKLYKVRIIFIVFLIIILAIFSYFFNKVLM